MSVFFFSHKMSRGFKVLDGGQFLRSLALPTNATTNRGGCAEWMSLLQQQQTSPIEPDKLIICVSVHQVLFCKQDIWLISRGSYLAAALSCQMRRKQRALNCLTDILKYCFNSSMRCWNSLCTPNLLSFRFKTVSLIRLLVFPLQVCIIVSCTVYRTAYTPLKTDSTLLHPIVSTTLHVTICYLVKSSGTDVSGFTLPVHQTVVCWCLKPKEHFWKFGIGSQQDVNIRRAGQEKKHDPVENFNTHHILPKRFNEQ